MLPTTKKQPKLKRLITRKQGRIYVPGENKKNARSKDVTVISFIFKFNKKVYTRHFNAIPNGDG